MNTIEAIQKYNEAKSQILRHWESKSAHWQKKVNDGKARPEAVEIINREIQMISDILIAVDALIESKKREGAFSDTDWQVIALCQAKFKQLEDEKEAAYFEGYAHGRGMKVVERNQGEPEMEIIKDRLIGPEQRRSASIALARRKYDF